MGFIELNISIFPLICIQRRTHQKLLNQAAANDTTPTPQFPQIRHMKTARIPQECIVVAKEQGKLLKDYINHVHALARQGERI